MIIKRGDLFPRVEAKVLDELGNAVDVTGGSVTFAMRNARAPGTKPVDGVAGGIIAPVTGDIYYQWAAGETDVGGTYEGEFRVSGVTNGPYRVPTSGYLTIVVEERVGTS